MYFVDWQVINILTYLEDFCHRLTSFEPRDYRVVFVIQKTKPPFWGLCLQSVGVLFRAPLFYVVLLAKGNIIWYILDNKKAFWVILWI